MAVKNLLIRGGADFSGVQKEMAKTQKTLSNFQNNVGGIMKKVGVVLGSLAVGKLVKDSTQMAMGVESAIGNINRNMGDNAKAFQNWANTQAQALGIAKADAYKYGGTFSNLLSSFTKNTKETASQTTELMKAAAIISSKTGRSYEDTAERIRSGMLGSTEAIEDLGVYTNVSMIESTEAFKRFANGKTWAQLDFQTQQQIRLAAILEQTYARYGNELANNTQTAHAQFIASLKNIQLSIGQAFMPIYSFVLPALTALANAIDTVFNYIAQFTTALFGKAADTQKQAQATTQQAKATTGLGNATEKAGKKAKKAGKEAKGALASFDEINSLSQGGSSAGDDDTGANGGIGDSGAMSMPALDTGGFASGTIEVSKKVQEMANKVKKIFRSISDEAGRIWDSKPVQIFVKAIGDYGNFLYTYWVTLLDNMQKNVVNTFNNIAPNLKISTDNLIALWTAFWTDFDNTLNTYGQQAIDGSIQLFNSIWTDAIDPFVQLVMQVWADFTKILLDLWKKYGKDTLDNAMELILGLQKTFQLLWDNILAPIIKPFLEMLNWLWNSHLKDMVQQAGELVMKLINDAMEIYNGFIAPVINWLIKFLGPAFVWAFTNIGNTIGTIIGVMADVAKGIFRALGGIIDFITGVFTGNWRKAWQGVKDIFGGIFEGLAGLIKFPLNTIIDCINAALRGINKVTSVINKIPGVDIGTIPQIPKLAKGGIVNSATMFMAGEAGKEAVMPLENNTGWITELAEKLNSRGGGSGGPLTVVLRVGKTELARVVAEGINDLSRQNGELILDI